MALEVDLLPRNALHLAAGGLHADHKVALELVFGARGLLQA